MRQVKTAGMLGLGLLWAMPAYGQMWFFPDYVVPSMTAGPATWLAGTYSRGVNEDSGEPDGFGAVLGRTGEPLSFMAGIGLATAEGDDEVTVGAAVGLDLVEGERYVLAVQGGVGWFSSELFDDDVTFLRFPVGIALKGNFATADDALVSPWIMPRLNFTRASYSGDSETETDVGISVGLTFTLPSGLGFHTALDLLSADGGDPVFFGIGLHYVLGER